MKTNWEALAKKVADALRELVKQNVYGTYGSDVDVALRQADRAIAAYDKAKETTWR